MKAYLISADFTPIGIVVGDEDEVHSRLVTLNSNKKDIDFMAEEYELLNEESYESFQRIRNLIDSAFFEYYCPDCNQIRLNSRSESDFFCGNCGKPNIIKGKPGTLDAEKLRAKTKS